MKSILVYLLLLISNISAQQFGLSPVQMWTDNYEIENPAGFSIYFSLPISAFSVRLEYIHAVNEREFTGYVITGFFSGNDAPTRQKITSSSALHAFELSAISPNLFDLFGNYLKIGFGVSHKNFTGERLGKSTREKVKLFSETKLGMFYTLMITRENLFALPINIELQYIHKGLAGTLYVTDSEQPFRGPMDVKGLKLNIAYSL